MVQAAGPCGDGGPSRGAEGLPPVPDAPLFVERPPWDCGASRTGFLRRTWPRCAQVRSLFRAVNAGARSVIERGRRRPACTG